MSKDKCIQKAEDELKILAGDWETRRIAILRKRYMLEMGTAEEWGYEKGEAAGEKRGIDIGEKRGIKKGTKQGIEKTRKITAIALIGEGMDNTFISRVTKLSVDEIEKLRKKSLKAVH